MSSYRFSGSHAAASIKPRRCVYPLFGLDWSALRTAKAVAINRFSGTTNFIYSFLGFVLDILDWLLGILGQVLESVLGRDS